MSTAVTELDQSSSTEKGSLPQSLEARTYILFIYKHRNFSHKFARLLS